LRAVTGLVPHWATLSSAATAATAATAAAAAAIWSDCDVQRFVVQRKYSGAAVVRVRATQSCHAMVPMPPF
jgi:hypothetical protein